ncbi:MAG: hypothetical protein EBS81_04410 [Gammaproteobacteria bacterium]|nr:hypothetical protein [Gammaproteobacteria bacterium]
MTDEIFDFGLLKKLLSDAFKKYADLIALSCKVPSKVEFGAILPHSIVGKILRRQLHDDQLA